MAVTPKRSLKVSPLPLLQVKLQPREPQVQKLAVQELETSELYNLIPRKSRLGPNTIEAFS